jgi:outer membrane protein TolC
MSTFISSSLLAQTKKISLNEIIGLAMKNNQQVKMAETNEAIATGKFKQTDAVFLPQAAVSYTALTTNNPLNAFGFKLQQQTVTAQDFNPSLLNDPGNRSDFVTKIELQQPIINLDLWTMRKSAAEQIALYKYQTKRTQEAIRHEITKAYLQLQLAYRSKLVLEEALSTAKAIEKFTNNRFEQGLLQQSDVLNTQVAVTSTETQLSSVQSNIATASDFISYLSGQPTGTIYEPVEASMINENVDSVPTGRADFKAMQSAIKSTELMIDADRRSYLPKLNAFASYQFNDRSMFGFGANTYLAGIQLSWNIFKGNSTKNKIRTSEDEKKKLEQQLSDMQSQSNLELLKTNRELEQSRKTILQSSKAVDLATESLRILRDRYEQGLVNTTDLLLAQTQLSQQKLILEQAKTQEQTALATLQFITSK